ncbi:MAG TPA: NADH-quinone oxidoreductase subunit C, partial [Candidatus Dormibacteraeota bacterium]|nr:NADH-quinone oxidoreductase subunit C [Candidatus Dormibacteraeota bacterium]
MMDRTAFLETVARYRAEGWRLALVNATAILPDDESPAGSYEVTWSFARDRDLEHLRERVLAGESLPSIGSMFPAAFLYENELRELFGIEVTGLTVDLAGQMYRTAERVPFS